MQYSLNNKRILVTGATGLIGSHLIDRLLEDNAEVIALGRNEDKLRSVFKDKLRCKSFAYLVGDISKEIPTELGKVDIIFHAASPISSEEIITKPVDVINANLSGTINCLEYLKKQKNEAHVNGRMIVFSSATVYGNNFEKDIVVTEEDTKIAEVLHSKNSPYAESKRMIEVISQSYFRQYGVESIAVRISYVYGFSKIQPNTAFYEFINKALRGEDIVLNNSGMAKRDNIYVKDVIDALICISENGEAGEVYNISSYGEKGNFKAIDEIAEVIVTSLKNNNGKAIRVITRENNKKRNPGILLDNSKLKSIGWNVQTDIEEGISLTIKGYMEN